MYFGQLFESLVPFADSVPAFRAILGVVLVFFVPCLAWSFVFFSRVNIIERIALSFGLSIAIVTLGIIALNMLFGMRISEGNALLIIIIVTVIAIVIYFLRKYLTRQSEASDGD